MVHSDIITSERLSQVAQVMSLIIVHHLSEEDACIQTGIEPATYRYWVRTNPEAIDTIRGFIDQQQREALGAVIAAKWNVLQKIIDDGNNVFTKPAERVTIYRLLQEVSDELQDSLHARPGIEEEAIKFLTEGPHIETKRSRFASIDVERTGEGLTINVYKDDKVIDGTVHPASPEQESPQSST